MGYLFPKDQLQGFLGKLMHGASFVAPVRRASDGLPVFEELSSASDLERLEFARVPQFPAKKYFMPATETLFSYDIDTQKLVERHVPNTPRILFGLRLCDLNAVKIQDKLFMGGEYVDDHYKAAREHIYLVGWYCNSPPDPEHCFCESMGLTNYYDLMLRETGERIYVDVGTPRGEQLLRRVHGLQLAQHHEAIPQIKTPKRLDTKDVYKHFNAPEWERTTNEQCLSCQRCTTLCPTCMCFDIYDTTQENLRMGARERTWDSCHSKEFSRVAGDHYFRPDRTARFKHRIFHKLKYYPEVFGTSMCTGCGRCIKFCPTHIDFVEIINRLQRGETSPVPGSGTSTQTGTQVTR